MKFVRKGNITIEALLLLMVVSIMIASFIFVKVDLEIDWSVFFE